MNDKYLWDRSGEPDPEIQQLEELLGTLRYEPQPLEIPAHFQITRRRSFYPPLAIAASLLFFAVAIGLWINFSRRPTTVAGTTSGTQQPAIAVPTATQTSTPSQRRPENASNAPAAPKPFTPRPRLVLASYKPPRRSARPPKLTPEELALKEQVLLALRLTSTKLNVAQRSVQGAPVSNTIRNQHKIG